jgi:cellulose synthase/poly-beta-1,6-N-acetylglucosamine synthase-like glycosyltransferase
MQLLKNTTPGGFSKLFVVKVLRAAMDLPSLLETVGLNSLYQIGNMCLVLNCMLLTILTICFLLFYGLLIFFYFHQWNKLPVYQPGVSTPSVFVSVIIAARNEEIALPFLIEDLKNQTYPQELFEIIIVNDHSTDNTETLAKDFDGEHWQMIFPNADAAGSSKKMAIATGIQKAKGEFIVITDADCRVNKKWMETMTNFYQEKEAVFIAAPVKFTHDHSLLEVFQVLDFITLQGITAASVSSNKHTMCNGANLAYTKQAFAEVNGFAGIDKVATGDDMLLMHKIWKAHPGKVHYLKSKDAIVETEPMKTWKDFLMQRKRWASKTLVYDDVRIIFVLAFVLLFNTLFFVLLVAAFFNPVYWIHFFAFLFSKTIIEWPFVSSVAEFYNEQKLMRHFFFIQPLHIFYTVFVGIFSQFGKYEWKGRRTR